MKPIRFSFAVASLLVVACSSSPSDPNADGTTDEAFTAAESVPRPEQTVQRVRSVGRIDAARVTASAALGPEIYGFIQDRMEAATHRPPAPAGGPPKNPPAPKASPRASRDGALYAFPGIGAADVDKALGGVAGITPPDQGLCVGNGFVLEAVNSSLQVYDILGAPVGAGVDLAPFFNFPPNTPKAISFASDPKCYFDHATGRFFATILRIPVDLEIRALTGSFLDIAVSQSNDPRGAWNVYEVDLGDNGQNGTPNHAHCPCLGDQPLIGADTNGFYVTTNEFGLDPNSPGFNGAQVYAFSKKSLVSGSLGNVVHFSNLVLANGIGYSLQPATSPSGNGAADANGTAYLLSALDFDGTLDNRIALWSLSNTASLDADTPAVTLEHTVLTSETYGYAPPAAQKAGPTPLRDCLAAGTCSAPGLKGAKATNALEQLSTNDDRMNQAVFAGGRVWGALNSVVQMASGPRAGIAYFSVQPRRLKSGALGGRMGKQGYIALDDADVMYPSVALTDDGRGAIAFSVSGENDYPSSAYVRLGATQGTGPVHISNAGAGPLDDFSGYTQDATQPQNRPARP